MTDDTLPVVSNLNAAELNRIATLGKWLALSESGTDSTQAKGASAALRLYYAEQLDLPPLAASELSVIRGRLVVGAKLLRAMAARHGYQVVRADGSDEKSCTAVLFSMRSGEEIGRSTFTIEDAKRAGLVRERSVWMTHPARMLWARASKFVLDDYVPQITLGIFTSDEVAEIEQTDEDLVYVSPIDEPVEAEDDPPSMSPGGLRLPAGTPAADATAVGQNP